MFFAWPLFSSLPNGHGRPLDMLTGPHNMERLIRWSPHCRDTKGHKIHIGISIIYIYIWPYVHSMSLAMETNRRTLPPNARLGGRRQEREGLNKKYSKEQSESTPAFAGTVCVLSTYKIPPQTNCGSTSASHADLCSVEPNRSLKQKQPHETSWNARNMSFNDF